MSWANGGMAAKSPITRLEALSFNAKATRKAPPVRVTIDVLAIPSLMIALRPDWTSSSVSVSLTANRILDPPA